jgi:predicted DNA-binding antitoxin AbrB/MazE fold protein
MTLQIEVIYENGTLRPLGPLPKELREHQRYVVSMELPPPGATISPCQAVPSLEEVRRLLAGIKETAAEAVRAERQDR